MRAHPRSRGENGGLGDNLSFKDGSSPLTRGKRRHRRRIPCRQRLIPAHAGKTSPGRNRVASDGAHPRSRGENICPRCLTDRQEGSSPLTRGKRSAHRRSHHYCGLIPAHAGKTFVRRCGGLGPGAHPRSRGENVIMMSLRIVGLGSSPLTRGKRLPEPGAGHLQGLIPAHAGKTRRACTCWCSWWAHPRSRGENALAGKAADELVGSSPLTRGKRCRRRLFGRPRRLIPAHAGKTFCVSPRRYCSRAHPRSRGENQRSNPTGGTATGSSPLTRGKRHPPRRGHERPGLIPAHAGKTAMMGCSLRAVRAHPRSRGENSSMVSTTTRGQGSSPLTRGKLGRGHGVHCSVRLIPAHAGKTAPAPRTFV